MYCKRCVCFHLIFTKNNKKRGQEAVLSEGGCEIISFPALCRVTQLADCPSDFPEVGICAKLCGASAYFSIEQYLETSERSSVIPGDSPEP